VTAAHWDSTYSARGPDRVSWFQPVPAASLAVVDGLGVDRASPVIDVGGGASLLVDQLVARGFTDVTVLDVSAVGLDLARARLGAAAPVEWIVADVLTWRPSKHYGLWHDRAVLHFLTDPADREAYLRTLRAAVPHGAVVLATFAPDGPETCSGLAVARYDADELAALLPGFEVVARRREIHVTPAGVEQPFTFVAARAAPGS
jgi:trans-aconitate methyltransferase